MRIYIVGDHTRLKDYTSFKIETPETLRMPYVQRHRERKDDKLKDLSSNPFEGDVRRHFYFQTFMDHGCCCGGLTEITRVAFEMTLAPTLDKNSIEIAAHQRQVERKRCKGWKTS